MVAAWSVDRLWRSLKDLIEVLSDLQAEGVDLYLHRQGVIAEFERAIIRERVLSGMPAPKAERVTLGRPALETATLPSSRPSRRR